MSIPGRPSANERSSGRSRAGTVAASSASSASLKIAKCMARARERTVARSASGERAMRKNTVFSSGSSSVFKSEDCASRLKASAWSMMTTFRPPRHAESESRRWSSWMFSMPTSRSFLPATRGWSNERVMRSGWRDFETNSQSSHRPQLPSWVWRWTAVQNNRAAQATATLRLPTPSGPWKR